MDTIGQLFREAFGPNPFASATWIGQAAWQTLEPTTVPAYPEGLFADYADGFIEQLPELQVLQVSVPPDLLWAACNAASPRAVASFLPWRDSGIGVITLTKADEALVVVMDLAGRADAVALRDASAEDRVAAALCTEKELEICPLLKVVGVSEALAEAASHRRLAAREVVEAIEDLRWILRTDAVFPLLGLMPTRLKSLTLNVCQPL